MSKSLETVDLHVIRLDTPVEHIATCRRVLSADEIARAERFRDKTLAECWIVARASLRNILAGYFDLDPAALRFDQQNNGKPIIAPARGEPPLHFNLSHSHYMAAIAITKHGPVGIDIEHLRRIRDWSGVASRFFSPYEQSQLSEVADKNKLHAFYTCWTRKEAVIKATGEGLSARLDEFDVSLRPDSDAVMIADRAEREDDAPWHLRHFEPQAGYVGAMAIQSQQPVTWRDIDSPGCGKT
jgi:4'-phosphopantetheinyl transferase